MAKGHADWVKHARPDLREHGYTALVVSPEAIVDNTAKAHVAGLNHVRIDKVQAFAARACEAITELRVDFSGKDYGAVLQPFKAKVRIVKLDRKHVDELLSIPIGS